VDLTHEQLSVRSITKLVTKVMAAANVNETAHGLRHTLATLARARPRPRPGARR
jgi:integrase